MNSMINKRSIVNLSYYLKGKILYKINQYTIIERTPLAIVLNIENGNIKYTSVSTCLMINNHQYLPLSISEMKDVGLSPKEIEKIQQIIKK